MTAAYHAILFCGANEREKGIQKMGVLGHVTFFLVRAQEKNVTIERFSFRAQGWGTSATTLPPSGPHAAGAGKRSDVEDSQPPQPIERNVNPAEKPTSLQPNAPSQKINYLKFHSFYLSLRVKEP